MSRKQKTSDVTVKTYKTAPGTFKTMIMFRNQVDELIDHIYVHIRIEKGAIFFDKGNVDKGDFKLSLANHNIQIAASHLQEKLQQFNGDYPLNVTVDGTCFVSLVQRIKTSEPTNVPIATPKPKINAFKQVETQSDAKPETIQMETPIETPDESVETVTGTVEKTIPVEPKSKPERHICTCKRPDQVQVQTIQAIADIFATTQMSDTQRTLFDTMHAFIKQL